MIHLGVGPYLILNGKSKILKPSNPRVSLLGGWKSPVSVAVVSEEVGM